jgi:hypothetical protein
MNEVSECQCGDFCVTKPAIVSRLTLFETYPIRTQEKASIAYILFPCRFFRSIDSSLSGLVARE